MHNTLYIAFMSVSFLLVDGFRDFQLSLNGTKCNILLCDTRVQYYLNSDADQILSMLSNFKLCSLHIKHIM